MQYSDGFDGAIGVTGRAALDGVYPHATCEIDGNKVLIHLRTRTHVVVTDSIAKTGDKIPGAIGPGLWSDVGDIKVGGSGPNSCIAGRLAAPNILFRYLDACAPHELIQCRLTHPGLETRYLGLEDVPTNVVLGVRDNRLIIKQKHCRQRAFADADLAGLRWLARCECVRANSVKHIEVAEYLAQEARAGNIKLHVVPSPYLPCDFVASRWLPAASEICTSQDEIGKVMGWDVGQRLADTPAVIGRIRELNKKAIIHVTRGDDGVVVSIPGEAEPVHVRLERSWDEVQKYVAEDPTVLCGAGDAFAMGSTLLLQTGLSVLEDMDRASPAAVRAAVAGSALAVRWAGWVPRLSHADFAVQRVPLPISVAAA